MFFFSNSILLVIAEPTVSNVPYGYHRLMRNQSNIHFNSTVPTGLSCKHWWQSTSTNKYIVLSCPTTNFKLNGAVKKYQSNKHSEIAKNNCGKMKEIPLRFNTTSNFYQMDKKVKKTITFLQTILLQSGFDVADACVEIRSGWQK